MSEETTITPELEEKLKNLGFQKTEFEAKTTNRFIVKLDGIPSYVVKGVNLPSFHSTDGWQGALRLQLYNPLDGQLEKTASKVILGKNLSVTLEMLKPEGEVDTRWTFNVVDGSGYIDFGALDWSFKGSPSLLEISFDVEPKGVAIEYPNSHA